MSTMNVSLPTAMKDYVDARVIGAEYGSASEYVRELIRRDQTRHQVRELLLAGAASPLSDQPGDDLFAGLRSRATG